MTRRLLDRLFGFRCPVCYSRTRYLVLHVEAEHYPGES